VALVYRRPRSTARTAACLPGDLGRSGAGSCRSGRG